MSESSANYENLIVLMEERKKILFHLLFPPTRRYSFSPRQLNYYQNNKKTAAESFFSKVEAKTDEIFKSRQESYKLFSTQVTLRLDKLYSLCYKTFFSLSPTPLAGAFAPGQCDQIGRHFAQLGHFRLLFA